MRKRILLIINLFILILIPFNVNASNISVSIKCNDIYTGETSTCKVYANVSGGVISALEGTISIKGNGSYAGSTSKVNGMTSISSNKFSMVFDEKQGSFELFEYNIIGNSAGSASLNVTINQYVDSSYNPCNVSIPGRGAFNISNRTQAPTTKMTTKARTTRTTRAGSSSNITAVAPTTAAPTTTQYVNNLKILSVSVDDFEVKEANGVYYVTVKPETEHVNINATVPDGITIIGTGGRDLAEGVNTVSLVIRDTNGGVATHSLVITRPSMGDHDTSLVSLDVVNYKISPNFSPNVTEYTVSIPYDVKEIYIKALANSTDVNVSGDGIYVIKNGNDNTAYVSVSYGDVSSTRYTIHIKKNYLSLIMWIIAGGIGFTLIVLLILQHVKKNNDVKEVVNEKNSEIANVKRKSLQDEMQISVGGKSIAGVGNRVVSPTRLPSEYAISQAKGISQTNKPAINSVSKQVNNVSKKVVQVRQIHAGEAPVIKTVHTNVIKGGIPQVKVVKRVIPRQNVVRKVVVNKEQKQN